MTEGLFLHTGWRSSGTWLWQQLRDTKEYMGFYEPLHEFLPTMSRQNLHNLSPQSWGSRHGKTLSPYFAEYEMLLRPDGKGVQLAQRRFAFSRFFMDAAACDDELSAYFNNLADLARTQRQLPAFKCTRTLGRLAWFQGQFPQMRHVALIRQPWAQFRSAWRCYAADGNKYFLATPFLVLERNTAHADVAALTQRFGLPLGWGRHMPLAARLKAWKLAVRLLDSGTLYKAHISLWLLNTLSACGAADLVLDGDAPPTELANALGLNVGPEVRPVFPSPPSWPKLTPERLRCFHDLALETLAHRISPATTQMLRGWLGAAEDMAERDLLTAACGPVP
jgi:hypothetical protein